jgi:hypothetical protein
MSFHLLVRCSLKSDTSEIPQGESKAEMENQRRQRGKRLTIGAVDGVEVRQRCQTCVCLTLAVDLAFSSASKSADPANLNSKLFTIFSKSFVTEERHAFL